MLNTTLQGFIIVFLYMTAIGSIATAYGMVFRPTERFYALYMKFMFNYMVLYAVVCIGMATYWAVLLWG
jgi:hypothetical protein